MKGTVRLLLSLSTVQRPLNCSNGIRDRALLLLMLWGGSCLNSFSLQKARHRFQHSLCILRAHLAGNGGSYEAMFFAHSQILCMRFSTDLTTSITAAAKQAKWWCITFKWRTGVWYTIGNILLLKTSHTEGALSAAFPQLFFIEITIFFFTTYLKQNKSYMKWQ